MADSILTIVLKSTINWLLQKGADRLAESQLAQGNGVVDQQICESIVHELHILKSDVGKVSQEAPNNMKQDVEEKSKIQAATEELCMSIGLYSEGISLISFAVNGLHSSDMKEEDQGAEFVPYPTVVPEAKDKFTNSREKAASAFKETLLPLPDRILAMYVRVKATLLEQIDDNQAAALVSCINCLEELHSMEEVKNSFELEFNKIPTNILFKNKNEITKQVVWSVRHVNRTVFDVAKLVGETSRQLLNWPSVTIGNKEKIDPLHELRLGNTLSEHDTKKDPSKNICTYEHNLTLPNGIATITKGKFVVVDIMKAKVFNSAGDLLYPLCLPNDDDLWYGTVDVDSDKDGNVYLLVWVANHIGDKANNKHWYEVFVFDKKGEQKGKFPLRAESRGRKLAVLTQEDDKVELLVLEGEKGLHAMVQVYETTEGKFVCQFGERILMDAQDIAAARKGHVFVLDKFHGSQGKCVHEFNTERKHLRSFGVDPASDAITFDQATGHIIIVSSLYDSENACFSPNVAMYNSNNTISDDYIDSKLLRSYRLDSVRILLDASVTVDSDGVIAVVLALDFDGEPQGKLIIMKETAKQ